MWSNTTQRTSRGVLLCVGGRRAVTHNSTVRLRTLLAPLSPQLFLHSTLQATRTLVTTVTKNTLSVCHASSSSRRCCCYFHSEASYHMVANETLEDLELAVEQVLERQQQQQHDTEVTLADGVWTLRLSRGTWVLNKQSPNQQIWWSSPISGPKRFEYNEQEEQWQCTRNSNETLETLLVHELQQCGYQVDDLSS